MELVLEVGNTRLHAQGGVAVVNPTTGMGTEFTSSEKAISRLPDKVLVFAGENAFDCTTDLLKQLRTTPNG